MTNAISIPGCVITDTGLEFKGKLTAERWADAGKALATVERRLMWLIGDWLVAGETSGYVERGRLDAACEMVGISYSTAAQAARVSKAFESCLRRQHLSWHAHKEVANREDATELLKAAEINEWTVEELRQEKKRRDYLASDSPVSMPDYAIVVDEVEQITMQYGTVYADPPWQYGNQATRASTGNHYDTMSIEDLCNMPVRDMAMPDAHLHLWTTNGFIREAFEVIDAWGFEYRSMFIWVKPQMGIGNYWRVSHELLLLGIRGDAKSFAEHSHMSWGQFNRGKHSAKPEEIRSVIERVSPGPYLELFGRKPVQGWTVFGNQIDKQLFS